MGGQLRMQAVVLLALCVGVLGHATWRRTLNDYMDTCMDGVNHKNKPGKEGDLYKQCSPWMDRACCTDNTSTGIHNSSAWLGFNWNHCPGQPLSDKCRRHFVQDLCFYECSPNVGPWLVKVNMKIRKERYTELPLCQSECDTWWADCKDDYTCKDNWGKGFNFSSGTSKCPTGSVCKKFSEHFVTANKFCKQIWDGSFTVVPDESPCMKIWFTGPNPNDEVAKWRAEQLINAATMRATSTLNNVLAILAVGALWMLNR